MPSEPVNFLHTFLLITLMFYNMINTYLIPYWQSRNEQIAQGGKE